MILPALFGVAAAIAPVSVQVLDHAGVGGGQVMNIAGLLIPGRAGPGAASTPRFFVSGPPGAAYSVTQQFSSARNTALAPPETSEGVIAPGGRAEHAVRIAPAVGHRAAGGVLTVVVSFN